MLAACAYLSAHVGLNYSNRCGIGGTTALTAAAYGTLIVVSLPLPPLLPYDPLPHPHTPTHVFRI